MSAVGRLTATALCAAVGKKICSLFRDCIYTVAFKSTSVNIFLTFSHFIFRFANFRTHAPCVLFYNKNDLTVFDQSVSQK
ncbi:MAG TPA: hypothetical protein DGX96_08535 [Lachnospiraceae bacterium]|jgi:hypothetical protein|nr:hypothetical protein [Lachnospiraceae bacterium]